MYRVTMIKINERADMTQHDFETIEDVYQFARDTVGRMQYCALPGVQYFNKFISPQQIATYEKYPYANEHKQICRIMTFKEIA